MGARVLLIAALSTGLAFDIESSFAQNMPEGAHALPPVEVSAPKASGAKRNRGLPAATYVARLRPRDLVATTPIPTAKVEADKVPASVNVVDDRQIARTGSLNITDALQQNVPGVNVSDVAGNPFQPDLEFRGFVASPVAGTPQGLAVYQNGVRVNEAFGDTINWDLIPTAAIKSVTVMTNNPAFGLNALGGAVNVQMKDGFTYHGAELDLLGGSFGRIQGSAQWGKQIDNFAVYGALEGIHEDGFRNFSPADIKRFYGDIGYRFEGNEFHLNMGVANNRFGAAATVPNELLQQFWGATYTTPQTSSNKVGYVNLTGKVDVSPSWTLDGNAHVRVFKQSTQDGNPTGVHPCNADSTQLCFGNDIPDPNDPTSFIGVPANGLNGAPLSNPFASDAVLGENDRTSTRSTTAGATLQATNTDQIFGHDNRFVVGASFDASVTNFTASAELGTLNPNFVVSGSGIFLGQSGNPVSIGPVSLRATNQYTGLYVLDTFDITKAFSVTAGGRFNYARISLQDQIGTALNGNQTFDRFNPIVGATYKITPELTAYAGYSEANRAPTPLELGCADPAHPCIIAAFLVSDPPLQQVVSRIVEAGLRGTKELNIGTLNWKLGGFRTRNNDDILNIPSTVLQGFGFFQNVGATRRQGIEADLSLTSAAFQLYASYTFVDARFLDTLQVGSNSPFADPDGNIQISPGNVIPSIPRHRIKLGFDYAVTDAFKVGGDALYVSSQFFAGDGSNQAPQLPSYAVFNLHASYQINKTYQIYGRVDNVLDNRYSTYGNFFDTGAIPNLAAGGAPFTDPTSLSPARPRAFYAGMKMTF